MCVPTLSFAQAGAEKILELNIVNDLLPPVQRLMTVCKGDRIRLRITSNTAGEMHLHAYRLSVHLQAGQMQEMALTAFATGRFRLEWHTTGTKSPSVGGHHAPALAMLEVRNH